MKIIDLDTVDYHGVSEDIVQILCKKTQSTTSPLFFRVLVSYYLCKVAATMRTSIDTHDRGVIPVNLYAINLATSGFGKGHSTNIMEDQIINQFKDIFMEDTLPTIAQKNLEQIAVKRANRNGVSPEEEMLKVEAEYARLGALLFSFDSGTSPAVKQTRHKLLMAGAGSVNLEIDEIGSKLLANTEVLTTFLELFDVGKVKQKLTKNTSENTRSEDITGKTPTNMMLFGTPSSLLNGGKEEAEFYAFQEAGFARRCVFGYSRKDNGRHLLTPEEIYDNLTDTSLSSTITALSDQFGLLADLSNFNKTIHMSKEVSIAVLAYKQECEIEADALPEHQEMRKAELSHRYFKALKLAGAYAFVDGTYDITKAQWWSAVKLIEDSGKAFNSILSRDRNYVKLAKYIADIKTEITHVDLVEDLPFYRGSNTTKREMMDLAIAYGYKHNIIIKKYFNGAVEFFKGESLQDTNLDQMIISYGTDIACNYRNEYVKFSEIHKLTQADGYHWLNHHCAVDESCGCSGHRRETNMKVGVNMVVIDVDGGVPLKLAQDLLSDYTYHIYTTKRHTPEENRFRIIMPLNYTLKLDAPDFKDFMKNIYEWLPFDVDTGTNQRSKKWLSHDAEYHDNEGVLLDATLFIPKTSKNDERKQQIDSMSSLDNTERWFITHTGDGNRSNQLVKFALMLVDAGFSFDDVRTRTLSLNSKLPEGLPEAEIHATILVTAAKAIAKKSLT